MNRRLAIWIYRLGLGHTRAEVQMNMLHAALGGAMAAIGGTALALIVVRPLLSLIPGWESVWR